MRTFFLGCSALLSVVVGADRADACLQTCNAATLSSGDARSKSIDGLECQIDWTDKDADWGYTNIGQICNGGYEEILVHCPLMRTVMKGSTSTVSQGLSCASATFTVQQQGGAGNGNGCSTTDPERWDCVLRSQDESGWYGWYVGSGPWSAANATGTYKFFAGFPGAKVWVARWQAAIKDSYPLSVESGGTYMMSCLVPPPTSCGGETCIASLRWWER